MELSRQEQWSGHPFPSPEDLPDSGIKPGSPVLQADSSPPGPPGKPLVIEVHVSMPGIHLQSCFIHGPLSAFTHLFYSFTLQTMLRHRVQVESREPSLQALSWPAHNPASPFREKQPSVGKDRRRWKGESGRQEARTLQAVLEQWD